MDPQNVPQHVAIIMDGNGRWATRQGLPRIRGHQVGVERVEEILKVAPALGVKYLTLYAFSKENWKRPSHEVNFLMELLSHYLDKKLEEFMKNNLIFNVIGRVRDLPQPIQDKIVRNREATRPNTGMTVTFAFSYSSRLEIVDACRAIAAKAVRGEVQPEAITEQTIDEHLYTAGIPDPDLLIRTSGEMRISNFLLWQISYAELYVTDVLWPEFTREEFIKAIEDYQKRERRFGRTTALKEGAS
jgi:undecaprenyl diphosphate synthase